MTKLFLSGLFVSFLASTVVYFARKTDFSDKVLYACFPIALYLVISNLFALFIEGFGVWEQARLVPTFAFYKNIQVYSTVQQGSVQTTMYPPVWVLSYLPIVLFKSPTAVMMMGRILAQTYSLLPVLLLLILCVPEKRVAFIFFAVFMFTAVQLPSLEYSCFRPHADAPSLGFSLVALIFLLIMDKKKRFYEFLFLILSLTMGFFAVLAKQVMFAIIPALLICSLILNGMKTFIRHCLWAFIIAILLAFALLSLFPHEGMVFNLITIPSYVGWHGTFPWNLGSVFWELIQHCSIIIIFMLAGSIVILREKGKISNGRWFKREKWILLTLFAVFNIPASVLGRVKIGGWPNTFSPTAYFLTVALVLQISDIHRLLFLNTLKIRNYHYLRLFSVLALIFTLSLWSVKTAKSYKNVKLARLRENPTQLAFEYLKKVDNNAYFPTQPLAHIMADGNLYNFSDAVHDREKLARIPLSAEQKNAHFPKSPSLVCWQRTWGSDYVRSRYFLDYNDREIVEELPRFECLRSANRSGWNP